jgi:N-acetylglucosamine kinase-like BadF-type ATPase
MRFYIGVDGGGSKTAVLAAAEDGSLFLRDELGSSSWHELGAESVAESIAKRLGEMLAGYGGMAAIGGAALGMPCVGESVAGDKLLRGAFGQALAAAPHFITNDVHVGWAGSLGLSPGVNVVAGTGSIAFGVDERGQGARSGGWDEFYSDEGSGYWLGRRTMELFAKQADGRVPKSALYEIFVKEFGYAEDFAFIDHMRAEYIGNRKKTASLQILTERAALAGDKSAAALYDEASEELAALAHAVCARLETPATGWVASYSGGVFKAGELILPKFVKLLEHRGIRVEAPRHSPVQGALLMAFERYCPAGLELIRKRIE